MMFIIYKSLILCTYRQITRSIGIFVNVEEKVSTILTVIQELA